jgi:outer membrane protein, heavy metal efflux system
MLKLLPILATLVLTALSATAEPLATNVTPERAVIIALEENRDLMAARFVIRQAEGRLRQAGLWPNPEFDLGRNTDAPFANEGEYDFSAGFKQRFPISGRLAKAKAVARVDVALAMAEVRNQERLLIGDVLGRSRDWLVLQEKLNANRAIQEIIQKLVDVSEKRLQVAEVSPADVNLAKLELQKLTLAEKALLNQQEVVTTALNQLLGREPKSLLELSGTVSIDIDTNKLIETHLQALARRPDRQLAAMAIDRAGAEIKLARAERWEDWAVGFDYSRERGIFSDPVRLDDTDNFIGLSVSIPLPLFNRNQGRISEAQATRQRAEAELTALELRINAEAQTAENQIHRLLGILRQYREESIKLADENVALLQKGYADGLVNITAVIQAQQQLTELRLTYWEVAGDLMRTLTDFETATASSPFLQPQPRPALKP